MLLPDFLKAPLLIVPLRKDIEVPREREDFDYIFNDNSFIWPDKGRNGQIVVLNCTVRDVYLSVVEVVVISSVSILF